MSEREKWFWSQGVRSESGCLIWPHAKNGGGYGRVKGVVPKEPYVHRIAYIIVKGPIPALAEIDHLCRTRDCYEPTHLEAVSSQANTLRSPVAIAAVNARKEACLNGHAFTAENTYYPPGRTRRVCRACHLERSVRSKHRA